MKKVISALTALVMTCTAILGVLPVSAEETQSVQPTIANDISIEGTNSFGNLLTDSLDGKMDEQQANNGCNVFSAEVTGSEATVSFETTESCTLLVAVYDEAGEQMLASGSVEVTAEETEKTVTIETDSMPKYFYLRAFLVNTVTLRPLCTVYESPNYTQEMQEFFTQTVDDFDSEKVLNLDEDKTNNFAVYADGTKIIQSDGTVNKVTKSDEENGIYIIENADSSVTSLSVGDIFALEQPDGNVLIVKVGTIKVSGSTVTITEQDTSVEEVFEYIRIDTSKIPETNTSQQSSTYRSTADPYSVYLPEKPVLGDFEIPIDKTMSQTKSISFSTPEISQYFTVGVKGGIEMTVSAPIKFYYKFKSFTNQYLYMEFKIEYSTKIFAEIEGTAKLPIDIGEFNLSGPYGINIGVTVTVEIGVSGKTEVNGTVKGSIGFAYDSNEDKPKIISSPPEFNSEIKTEASIFLALSLKPNVNFINDDIADVELELRNEIEAKGEKVWWELKPDSNVRHACQNCVDGEINRKFSELFNVKLLKKAIFKNKLYEFTDKWDDFYYSYDYDEFGFGTCPHKEYRVMLNVQDENGNPVGGAQITYGGLSTNILGTTDENGRLEVWLANGEYKLTAKKDNSKAFKDITVHDNGKSIQFTVRKPLVVEIPPEEPDLEIDNQRLSLGSAHSGYIDENGSLFMWGNNCFGQLGNGKTTDSLTPIKIMSSVKYVSLDSSYSATITEYGSLYMWGRNDYGRLGNGTTEDSLVPIKIMDNVKFVSLGAYHSAAITEDGSLYMWGRNNYGQIGNKTTTDSLTSIKILNNVKSVSLGVYHSAAITEDGSLYMWGRNNYGQLGNGTTEDSLVPIKIMNNVKAVSLDESYSAAITEDGSFYMWGHNNHGQLGNETTTDSLTPIKILNNVKAVSLDNCHSAAITENGSLYMWGRNNYGQLGNGQSGGSLINYDDGIDSSIPLKIMDKVKTVSLGSFHSAAITEDGSLYLWGHNFFGELGNGTTEDSSVPIKIEIPSENASAQSYSLTPQITYLSDEPTLQTKAFTNLLPNEIYNFYMIKSSDANPLSGDNLLYAGQGISDENGSLTVSYIPKAEYADAKIFIKGMTRTDLSGAQVTVPDILCNGSEQFAQPEVTLDGVTLNFGDDYDIAKDYSAVIPGEYELIISGINDYAGEVSAVYNVYCEHSFSNGKCTICGSLETVKGDVNGDGVTGIADIVALQKYLVKLKTDVAVNADVNGDGIVNVFDDVILKRMILNS